MNNIALTCDTKSTSDIFKKLSPREVPAVVTVSILDCVIVSVVVGIA